MDQLQGKSLWHSDRQDGGPPGGGRWRCGGGGLQALSASRVLLPQAKLCRYHHREVPARNGRKKMILYISEKMWGWGVLARCCIAISLVLVCKSKTSRMRQQTGTGSVSKINCAKPQQILDNLSWINCRWSTRPRGPKKTL